MSLAEAVRVEDEAGYVKRAIGEAENREEAVALLCAWAEKDIGLRDALDKRLWARYFDSPECAYAQAAARLLDHDLRGLWPV